MSYSCVLPFRIFLLLLLVLQVNSYPLRVGTMVPTSTVIRAKDQKPMDSAKKSTKRRRTTTKRTTTKAATAAPTTKKTPSPPPPFNEFNVPPYTKLTTSPEWSSLLSHSSKFPPPHSPHPRDSPTHLLSLLSLPNRTSTFYTSHDGVLLDYTRQRIDEEGMSLLMKLARGRGLKEKIDAMFRGEKINFTEGRPALHTALRLPPTLPIDSPVVLDPSSGLSVHDEVYSVLSKIKRFTNDVRNGKIKGYTGRKLKNVISVGIGGSYLGPEFLHEVLKTEPTGVRNALGYNLRFLSNVDPVDVERTCSELNPEETLVVVVSKTFTTAETMLNARTVRQWLWDFMGNDKEVVGRHMVACAASSSESLVKEFGIDTESNFFKFWDWVGGRYSVCSAAGGVPISLVYGFDMFREFLDGAQSIDRHFETAPFEKNIPVLMGLLGVWNMSFLKYKMRTCLPYAEALLKFPAHIQQLDMESNGKSVDRFGEPVDYLVGEVDFGEPGTNGQHSFFQLLHMGQPVPCDFIGFVRSQHDLLVDGETLSSHDELMANFFAQPDALAKGKTRGEVEAEGVPKWLTAHKTFEGNRPSLSLLLPQLTAYTTGQLLAIYEHRTAVQGFIWDINSFDQFGVELGKELAKSTKEHIARARQQNTVPFEESEAGILKNPNLGGINPSTQRMLNYYIRESATDHDANVVKHGGSGNEGTKKNWFQRTFQGGGGDNNTDKEARKERKDQRNTWIL